MKTGSQNTLLRRWKQMYHSLTSGRRNGSGVHSPYLYRFVTSVLFNPWKFYAFDTLNNMPEVRTAACKPVQKHLYEMLFRIVQDLQPKKIIDLDSGEVLESLYLKAGCPEAEFISGGHTDIRNILLGDKAARPYHAQDHRRSLILLSAEGQYATTEFLNHFFPLVEEKSIVIIRKPHADTRAGKIWKYCKTSGFVHSSIDLYHAGILFFREDLPDNHLKYKLK